ncbi:spirocyclase AveC family protein [Streptomyces spectabilis]|uniref:Spirocyclase, AveC family n=1 Tax=Streptomyces spectabilis TaxID=68270 RepID=A0A516R1S5_STRST|nr:spirocyclase AveC family protein [Streptomyces spectabilis]QDQ09602.1 spirocyclase, AveC family [Streptomyces spectabilis]
MASDTTSPPPAIAPATSGSWFLLPRPVWTGLGLVSLVLQLVIYGRWLADGGYRLAPTRSPDDDFPIITQLAITAFYSVIIIAGLVVYLRRMRREGRMNLELAMCLGTFLSLWIEPLVNIRATVMQYNAHGIGVISSWAPYVPGWSGQPARYEPNLPLILVSAWVGGAIAGMTGCSLLIRLRRRHQLSTARFIPLFVGTCILFTLLADPLFYALGFFRWDSGITGFTLFPGTWHQFPVYETICFSTLMLSYLAFYYWYRTKGTDFFDPSPTAPRPLRRVIPVLAVIGVTNAIMLFYISILGTFGQFGTISPDHLPEFWVVPSPP